MEYGLMGGPPPRSQSQYSMHAGTTDSGIVNGTGGKLSRYSLIQNVPAKRVGGLCVAL